MANLIEYKCPCCGGAIEFDSSLQKMKCPYCDTEFEMETLKQYDEDLKNQIKDDLVWESTPTSEWSSEDESELRSYVCNSCGGEILTDLTTAATHCPFCGNPVVMKEHFSGDLKPEFVIPFKLDKNAAINGLKKHLEGKKLLPKVFKDENHIEEIKGIYVPVWLFDADANADIRYKGTKVRVWSDSNYNYTETSTYSVVRKGSLQFKSVPVDGSSKFNDDLMESIEPFNFEEAVDFQTAYLAGYLADKYDVSEEQSIERANSRIKRCTEDAFAQTIGGYSSLTPQSSTVQLSKSKAKYALYPVWLLNTYWNGSKYTFAMNGQTGKFVGNLPMDKKAYYKYLFGSTVGISAVIFGLLTLLSFM